MNLFTFILLSYTRLLEIIDKRWDNELHKLLHVAGSYLIPILHYNAEFIAD